MNAVATLDDFSEKLGPIFVRDLRQGLRTQVFVWAFILLQTIALATLLIDWGAGEWFSIVGGISASFPSIFIVVMSLLFSLVLPLTQFAALQSELGRGRNIELLLCSQLSRWQIVRGKFFVACALSGLLLISLLPFMLIRYFIGGVELLENLSEVSSMFVSNATMNAIVIGTSGFANPTGRIAVIILTSIAHSITVATLPAVIGFSSGSMFVPTIAYFAAVAGSVPFMLLGLQLARGRIRVSENPIDPPMAGIVLILIFCTPILNGIAIAVGGAYGSAVVLAGVSVLALFMDQGPGRRKQLKGAQP